MNIGECQQPDQEQIEAFKILLNFYATFEIPAKLIAIYHDTRTSITSLLDSDGKRDSIPQLDESSHFSDLIRAIRMIEEYLDENEDLQEKYDGMLTSMTTQFLPQFLKDIINQNHQANLSRLLNLNYIEQTPGDLRGAIRDEARDEMEDRLMRSFNLRGEINLGIIILSVINLLFQIAYQSTLISLTFTEAVLPLTLGFMSAVFMSQRQSTEKRRAEANCKIKIERQFRDEFAGFPADQVVAQWNSSLSELKGISNPDLLLERLRQYIRIKSLIDQISNQKRMVSFAQQQATNNIADLIIKLQAVLATEKEMADLEQGGTGQAQFLLPTATQGISSDAPSLTSSAEDRNQVSRQAQ
ncbi:hypothetical protein A2335_02230 [Candidatus Peregrinibacteria bacterium RIFOXYB2_FULL_32_7]|nr:MAG: hypothetical protein A2335_02230 [Candidatus Peregrinibacteria bacterium RIFOXYB2_FULL_32_7]